MKIQGMIMAVAATAGLMVAEGDAQALPNGKCTLRPGHNFNDCEALRRRDAR